MSHEYFADAERKSKRRARQWYQNYILKVLQDKKEKQVREIDASISLAKKLLEVRVNRVAYTRVQET